jgi:hypothetical protein
MKYTKDFNVVSIKQTVGIRYFVWQMPGCRDAGREEGYTTEAEAKQVARKLQRKADLGQATADH